MPTTVAIAGISSRLALLVTKALLERPDVHIRGSCRDINKLPDELKDSPRVALIQSGPYDNENLRALIGDSDVVMCAYFADDETMLSAQKLLIDLCAEKGITRYIASDYTADYRKLDWGDLAGKEPMKHIAKYVEEKQGLEGVHILIGLFMETFLLKTFALLTKESPVRGERKSARELAADVESGYGFRPTMESRGSLTDLQAKLDGKGNKEMTLE